MKKRLPYLSVLLAGVFCLILCFLLRIEHPIASEKIRKEATFATQIQATSNRLQSRDLGTTDPHCAFQSSAFYRTIVDNNLFRPLGWTSKRPREPYRLLGTILPTDANTPKQAILERTAARRTYTGSLGETLDKDTIVIDIQPKQVTLEKASVRRTLRLNTTPLLK